MCCMLAGEFIIGRVIKAMNNSWHPECFCCDICSAVLADVGFVKNAGRWVKLTTHLLPPHLLGCVHSYSWLITVQTLFDRHLCRPCHNREKARGLGKYICQKCHAIIDELPLIFKNDPYHPDHFNCNNCGSVKGFFSAIFILICLLLTELLNIYQNCSEATLDMATI